MRKMQVAMGTSTKETGGIVNIVGSGNSQGSYFNYLDEGYQNLRQPGALSMTGAGRGDEPGFKSQTRAFQV